MPRNKSYFPLSLYAEDGTEQEFDFDFIPDFASYLRFMAMLLRHSADAWPANFALDAESQRELADALESCARGEDNSDLQAAERGWNLAVITQIFWSSFSKTQIEHGFKMWNHLQSASRRKDVTRNDVEQTIEKLRRENPLLSETELRKHAAKELTVSYATIMRRLGKKK